MAHRAISLKKRKQTGFRRDARAESRESLPTPKLPKHGVALIKLREKFGLFVLGVVEVKASFSPKLMVIVVHK
jgi:hypothetical protein